MTGPVLRVAAAARLGTLATLTTWSAPAVGEPRPRGALELTGELLVTGGPPRRRAGLAATAFLTRRLGVRAAVHLLTLEPLAEAGAATVAVAYRAAAARPRLEVVVRAEAGAAWPGPTPVLGAGATTYLWPTKLPLALAFDLGAVAIVDGVDDSRVAIGLGLGLALAR